MYIYEKRIEIMRRWPIGLFLGAVDLCFLGSLAMPKGLAESDEVLHDAVVEGIQANIAKLTSAVIVWRSENSTFSILSDSAQKKGAHQLWWSGEKIAIKYRLEYMQHDENGQVLTNTSQTIMAYNGKDFRIKDVPKDESEKVDMALLKKPEFKQGENYLRDVGWQGRGLLSKVFVEPTEPGTDHWSLEDGKNGSKLIKREFRNSRTGQIGRWYYDVGKGYGLVCYENYASATQLALRTTIRYEQVAGGAWFPVDVNTVHFNIQNGEKIACTRTEVDVTKSVFNEPSAIPEGIFELEIGPNTEVSDYLLGERLLYSTDVTPIAMETLRDVMDDFLANDGTLAQASQTDRPNKSSAADVDANTVVDSNKVGVISQVPVIGNERSMLPWFLIAMGAIVCVLGIVMWTRRSRGTSVHP